MKELIMQGEDERRIADQYKEQVCIIIIVVSNEGTNHARRGREKDCRPVQGTGMYNNNSNI